MHWWSFRCGCAGEVRSQGCPLHRPTIPAAAHAQPRGLWLGPGLGMWWWGGSPPDRTGASVETHVSKVAPCGEHVCRCACRQALWGSILPCSRLPARRPPLVPSHRSKRRRSVSALHLAFSACHVNSRVGEPGSRLSPSPFCLAAREARAMRGEIDAVLCRVWNSP